MAKNLILSGEIKMLLDDGGNQGDQIGRIFAHWAIVFFGHILENSRSGTNSLASFCHETKYVLIFDKIMGWETL
jgi:hypothetical protein